MDEGASSSSAAVPDRRGQTWMADGSWKMKNDGRERVGAREIERGLFLFASPAPRRRGPSPSIQPLRATGGRHDDVLISLGTRRPRGQMHSPPPTLPKLCRRRRRWAATRHPRRRHRCCGWVRGEGVVRHLLQRPPCREPGRVGVQGALFFKGNKMTTDRKKITPPSLCRTSDHTHTHARTHTHTNLSCRFVVATCSIHEDRKSEEVAFYTPLSAALNSRRAAAAKKATARICFPRPPRARARPPPHQP
jgi:hypothetical protein